MAKTKKYRGVKYMGDDAYSWAIFLNSDIRGLRSPISEHTKVKPLYSGLTRAEKNFYVSLLEKKDAEKENK